MTTSPARSPFRAALAGIAPKVARQRIPFDRGARFPAPWFDAVCIGLCLIVAAYFAWQFAR